MDVEDGADGRPAARGAERERVGEGVGPGAVPRPRTGRIAARGREGGEGGGERERRARPPASGRGRHAGNLERDARGRYLPAVDVPRPVFPRVLGALLLAAALSLPAGAAAQDEMPLGPDSRIAVREIVEGDSIRRWSATARIPVIEGPAAADPGWAAFEAALDSIVREQIDGFRENLAGWDAPPGNEWASFLEADGSVAWVEPPLLSLILDVSVYYAGAAHPGHYAITLVWDAARERALRAEDLFLEWADWPETLSRVAIPALERDLGEMADADWIAEGAGPSARNFTRWALVEEGLLVLFDPYQVAPYAAGPQAVTIPRAALADIADPAGPLAPQ